MHDGSLLFYHKQDLIDERKTPGFVPGEKIF